MNRQATHSFNGRSFSSGPPPPARGGEGEGERGVPKLVAPWGFFIQFACFFARRTFLPKGKCQIPTTGGKNTPVVEVNCGCALLAPAVFVEHSAHRGCGFV